MNVMLSMDDWYRKKNIIVRKKDSVKNPIAARNNNTLIDSRVHVIEFDDGMLREYAENYIAENMYVQVND